jgi:hypothetical protein
MAIVLESGNDFRDFRKKDNFETAFLSRVI